MTSTVRLKHNDKMKLDTFLKSANLDDEAFGAQIQRDRTTVYRLRTGKRAPDWDTVIKIREATGGKVSAEDWLETILQKREAEDAA